jgi:hypothetical protein
MGGMEISRTYKEELSKAGAMRRRRKKPSHSDGFEHECKLNESGRRDKLLQQKDRHCSGTLQTDRLDRLLPLFSFVSPWHCDCSLQ